MKQLSKKEVKRLLSIIERNNLSNAEVLRLISSNMNKTLQEAKS